MSHSHLYSKSEASHTVILMCKIYHYRFCCCLEIDSWIILWKGEQGEGSKATVISTRQKVLEGCSHCLYVYKVYTQHISYLFVLFLKRKILFLEEVFCTDALIQSNCYTVKPASEIFQLPDKTSLHKYFMGAFVILSLVRKAVRELYSASVCRIMSFCAWLKYSCIGDLVVLENHVQNIVLLKLILLWCLKGAVLKQVKSFSISGVLHLSGCSSVFSMWYYKSNVLQ